MDAQREKLLREASVEEHKIQESLSKLRDLGIPKVDELSVEDLVKLREQTEAELHANLTTVKAQIAEANKVLAEYEAAVVAG